MDVHTFRGTGLANFVNINSVFVNLLGVGHHLGLDVGHPVEGRRLDIGEAVCISDSPRQYLFFLTFSSC